MIISVYPNDRACVVDQRATTKKLSTVFKLGLLISLGLLALHFQSTSVNQKNKSRLGRRINEESNALVFPTRNNLSRAEKKKALRDARKKKKKQKKEEKKEEKKLRKKLQREKKRNKRKGNDNKIITDGLITIPTQMPSTTHSYNPTMTPSVMPSTLPSYTPTTTPSFAPSTTPSHTPTTKPSMVPSTIPSYTPTSTPSMVPTKRPSITPTTKPSIVPSTTPSHTPTSTPSMVPTTTPSHSPSNVPSVVHSTVPSNTPTIMPSIVPTTTPSNSPSNVPSAMPSTLPSSSTIPSLKPSIFPTTRPSTSPSSTPTTSNKPTSTPFSSPSSQPSNSPSLSPSTSPTFDPSSTPSTKPSEYPTTSPSFSPSSTPSALPSSPPSVEPTTSSFPTLSPSTSPSSAPSESVVCGGMTIEQRNDEVRSKLLTSFPTGLHTQAENWIVHEDSRILCSNDTTLEQRYILSAFYFDANGEDWIKGAVGTGGRSWLSKKSECAWFGITCNDFGFIRNIHLDNNNMFGTISETIESLSSLRELFLFENKLSGPFPRLPDSTHQVSLHHNRLSGVLPDIWPKKMSHLIINHNKFSGSINSLSTVTNARVLELYRNDFNGTVSIQFGALTNMTTLTLHKNLLTGSMPDDVCLLRDIALPSNKLSTLTADCKEEPTAKVVCDSVALFGEACCTACH